MNKQIKDLTGRVYDRLTVIGLSHSEKGKTYWNCYCSCDENVPIEEREIHIIRGKYMQDGSTGSCGCKKREHIKQVGQHTNKKQKSNKPYYSLLKNIWNTLVNRCHNPKYNRYKFDGGKGVYVYNEWKENFDAFYEWALKNGYYKGLALNIIDKSKNYTPDNCEWRTKELSGGDTNKTILTTIGGRTQSLTAWSKDPECEVSYDTIRKRYHKDITGIALIKKEKTFKDLTFKYKKKTQTFKEWSLELNIPLHILRDRYSRGNRGEKLFGK